MPYCQRCGFSNPNRNDTQCPVCSNPYSPVQPAPSRPRGGGGRGNQALKRALDITARIVVLIMVMLFFIHPGAKPYREDFFEYLNAGLEHYQESPPSSEVEVKRVIWVEAGASEVKYSLKVNLPSNIYFTDSNGRQVQVQQFITLEPLGPQGAQPSVLEDDLQNDVRTNIARWENMTLDPDEKHSFEIYYHFNSIAIQWDLSMGNTGSLSDLETNPEYKKWFDRFYMNDEYTITNSFGGVEGHRIEPSNPTIEDLAYDIANEYGTGENVYNILEAFYKYMREEHSMDGDNGQAGLQYPTEEQQAYDSQLHEGKPKPAHVTLQDGYGDCDDQAIVYVSLCRAIGIPAWIESGALYDPFAMKWENHGWAQIYVPLKGGGNATANVDIVNSQFLMRDSNRFTDWFDTGIEGDMEDSYNNLHYWGESAKFHDEYEVIRFTPQESDIAIKV